MTAKPAASVDDGRVLITGGRDASDRELSTAETYDPSTGTRAGRGAGCTDAELKRSIREGQRRKRTRC
jgi:hypothetical protein